MIFIVVVNVLSLLIMIDILKLYEDYSIPTWTEGNNCQPGWVNTTCPFCGDQSNHLGYSLDDNYFNCWRCGKHPIAETISKLIKVTEQEARKILHSYGDQYLVKPRVQKIKIRKKAFHFPSSTEPLTERHKQYLEGREFDPEKLEHEWKLLSTGPSSMLDKRDYKNRIIAPIEWNGKCVSFQGRSTSDKRKPKYKACPEDRELVHHKVILYGKQSEWEETGICVEGITDVWRLGPKAFATFGIEYTRQQVRMIANTFERVAVVFDDEKQAVRQAEKLVNELQFRGVDAWRVPIVGDPGGMKQDEANYLIKQISI